MSEETKVAQEAKGLLEEARKQFEFVKNQAKRMEQTLNQIESINKLAKIIEETRESEKKIHEKMKDKEKKHRDEIAEARGKEKELREEIERLKKELEKAKGVKTSWSAIAAKGDGIMVSKKEREERQSRRLTDKEIIVRSIYFNRYKNGKIQINLRYGRAHMRGLENNGTIRLNGQLVDAYLWMKQNSLDPKDVLYIDFMKKPNSEYITVKVVLETREKKEELMKSWESEEKDEKEDRRTKRNTMGAGMNESNKATKDWRCEENIIPERLSIKSPNTPKKVNDDQDGDKGFNVRHLGKEKEAEEEKKKKDNEGSVERELKEKKGDKTDSEESAAEADGGESKEEALVEEPPYQRVGRDGRHRETNDNDRLENNANNNNNCNNSNMGGSADKRLRRNGLRSCNASVPRNDEKEATTGDKGKDNK